MRLLQSKLVPPQRPRHLIDRPRLLRSFTVPKRTLLYALIAPAGYGKTMLALQALARVPAGARAWLHLDHQDADPRRFLHYLIAALSPSIRILADSGLSERLAVPDTSPVEVIEDLCFVLQEYRGPECWLVLDNWEQVNTERDITRMFAKLVRNTGGRVRWMINSRVKPAFPLAKLQEQGRAKVITQRDLAFAFPEFARAARKRIGVRVAPRQLEEIWRLTLGWCVNLGLVVELLQQRGAQLGADLSAAVRQSDSLANYLEEELLCELPETLGDFLARCSLLDVLTPESCAVLLKDPEAIARNLRALENSAIPHFVLPEENSIRLHPLIREAAERRLRSRVSAGELMRLHSAAAEYYEKQGRVLEAVDLLIALPDWEAAITAIDRTWFTIIQQNALHRVESWLERMPEDMQEHPLYVKTVTSLLSLAGSNVQLSAYLVDRLDPRRFGRGDPVLGHLWINQQWARIHSSLGPHYERVKGEWRMLSRLRGPFSPTVRAGVDTTLACAAALELRFGVAIRHQRACLKRIGDSLPDYRINSLNTIALFEHSRGNSAKGLAIFEENVSECEERQAFAMVPNALVNIADIHLDTGHYAQTLAAVRRCEACLQRQTTGSANVRLLLERFRGVVQWVKGFREEGLRQLAESRRMAADSFPTEATNSGLMMEYFHILSGRPRVLVAPEQLPPAGAANDTRPLYAAKEGHLAIHHGDWTRLAETAAELLATAR